MQIIINTWNNQQKPIKLQINVVLCAIVIRWSIVQELKVDRRHIQFWHRYFVLIKMFALLVIFHLHCNENKNALTEHYSRYILI